MKQKETLKHISATLLINRWQAVGYLPALVACL